MLGDREKDKYLWDSDALFYKNLSEQLGLKKLKSERRSDMFRDAIICLIPINRWHGNLLINYNQDIITRSDYYKILKQYASQHFITENGEKTPFLDEDLDPFTGEWIAKKRLEEMKDPPGGADRGRDYNHSTFCDPVLSGLAGVRACGDDKLMIDPLFSTEDIEYMCADGILYHGHYVTVLWDKSGDRYNMGKGFKVYIDGNESF